MDHLLLLSLLLCFLILQCPFSFSLKSLTFLDLGSNLFEGPLPTSLCNLKDLEFLFLSDNKFTGEIPHCYSNISSQLRVLDLRNNGFHGTIPTNFPEGNQLRNLGLNGNQLEGPIPTSLIKCKSLEILDLGHNRITDTFPMWLESLPKLSVLILKSNQLHGSIGTPKSESPFKKLRILDISYNQFTGSLPAKLIENFQAMMKVVGNQTGQVQYMGDGTYYDDSITIVMKGLEIVLHRVLTIFTTIDLSENQFGGKIPDSVGHLRSLKLLNFSYNKLDGLILPTLGDLSELESLDLSWNQLEGKIPVELGKLHFLSFLNLSQNHLEGLIPQGGQFNTFTNYSYLGNKWLCGFPLKGCGEVDGTKLPTLFASDHTDFLDVWSGLTWKSVILGYSFGTILGLAIGILAFSTRKPKWLVIMVEDMSRTSKRPSRRSLRWL